MKCKKFYKDMEKYRNYKNNSQKRNRKIGRIGTIRHKWTKEEIQLILTSKLTDRELSKIIKHSIQAIQIKRSRVKGENNNV